MSADDERLDAAIAELKRLILSMSETNDSHSKRIAELERNNADMRDLLIRISWSVTTR